MDIPGAGERLAMLYTTTTGTLHTTTITTLCTTHSTTMIFDQLQIGSCCESTLSEDESNSDSGTHSKRQKRGFSTSAAKKMAELKKD
jgi:hypothetical protein